MNGPGKNQRYNYLVRILLVIVLLSCENPFVYSPFQGKVESRYKETTEKNLARIKAITTANTENFKVALLSDPHYHFDELHDAVTEINTKHDIEFVIVTGDISESGLYHEFVFFHDIMKRLNVPYVTVIGNHDYLSNGGHIYHQMYGDFNYSFVFNNVKFVLFDNVFWESKKLPDFGWLEAALENDGAYDHVIPFSHIPPFDQQFTEHREMFHAILSEHQIKMSIHGHKHEFSQQDIYGDGLSYVTIGSPQRRVYCELTISPDQVSIEKVNY